MDLLPEDLLADILRRLPLRPLAVCRSVSTHLRAIIDSRGLLAAHLAPRGLRGIFVTNAGQSRPYLISRRAAAPRHVVAAGDDAELTSRHIDGLLLVQDREKLYNQLNAEHDFLYPRVTLRYEVISVSEAPSSSFGRTAVFSTRTGRWVERAYREGDVAVTLLDVECHTHAGREHSISIVVGVS